MDKKTKCAFILIVLLAGVSMLPAGNRTRRPPIPPRANSSEQEADPYRGRTLLVEAFVVEVQMATLYDMGVNPLGQAPHSVSVANLLECLQRPDQANILVGAKAVGLHGVGNNAVKRSETSYYPRRKLVNTPEGRPQAIDYTAYEDGETLSIIPGIISEQVIQVSYSFNYSGPRQARQHEDAPPDTVAWEWEGTASLNVGQPRIVGATQSGADAIFFVLTAHLLD